MITIFPTTQEELERVLPWPLWIARVRGGPVTIAVPFARAEGQRMVIGLGADAKHKPGTAGVAAVVRQALDTAWGEGAWCPAEEAPDPSSDDGEAEEVATTDAADEDEAACDPVLCVTLVLLPTEDPVSHVLELIADAESPLVVLCAAKRQGEESEQARVRRQLLKGASCEVVLLRAGRAGPSGHGLLAPVARGPHAQAALRLTADLADADHGPAAALYVEPQVGEMASRVGSHILAVIVKKALQERTSSVTQEVVIDDQPHKGVLTAVAERKPELVLIGSSKQNAIGQRLRSTVGLKVVKGTDDPAVAVVRAAVPLRARTLRALGEVMQRAVPQMDRDARIDLVERVQSNSQWDFDFTSLMALSTAIAAVGLIQSSAAVVIGAMLVAPLMTPLLGLGLGMTQGNPYLVKSALRSIVYGVALSFGLAFVLGWTAPDFHEATREMLGRNWPSILDLFVAFVSGVAAAYASSRANLLAALPGVAIAAALVPPITTGGLAAAVGNPDLAMGAMLLFGTNMVAIVLASAFTLWMVGLRGEKGSRLTKAATWTIAAATLVLGIQLGLAPPKYRAPVPIPREAVDRVEAVLAGVWRLQDIDLDKTQQPAELSIHIGGSSDPPAELAEELRKLIQEYVEYPIDVRLRHHWAVSARHPDG